LQFSNDIFKLISKNRASAIEKKKRFRERLEMKKELTGPGVEICKKNRLRAIKIEKPKAFSADFP